MGKTVKNRTIFSIASFLFVVAFCLVANSSVPKLYESYKQKAVAQQAASQTVKPVKKETPVNKDITVADDTAAEDETIADDSSFSEDSNVYDIVEETPVEETPVEEEEAEEPEEDFDFDFDIGGDEEEEDKEESSGGFLGMIISFITSLIDKITSLDIFGKLKEFFASILKLIGIEI